MKIRTLCRGLALLVVMSVGMAHAQDLSLGDALSGQTLPLTFKPTTLPADFKAVKICQSGTGQVFGTNGLTIPATTPGTPAAMFVEILPISWTDGQIITVAGQPFLVTYGVDLGANTLKAMNTTKKIQSFSLRLKLIKTSEIGSITPLPEWDRSKYLRAMSQIVVEGPTRIAMNTPVLPNPATPALPTPIMATTPKPVAPSTATPSEVSPGATAMVTPSPTVIPSNTTPAPATAVKGVSTERPVETALYTQAEQNAKSIASAMLVYAQDYDGTFPYVQSSKGAAYVLYPYVKGTNVYQTMNPVRGGEFRFNMSLAGVKMADITDAVNTPLFYDAFAWPNATYLVAFADSHVKFLTPDEWETVKKNLSLKLPKNGKPLPADLALPDPSSVTTPVTPATTQPAGGN